MYKHKSLDKTYIHDVLCACAFARERGMHLVYDVRLFRYLCVLLSLFLFNFSSFHFQYFSSRKVAYTPIWQSTHNQLKENQNEIRVR